MTTYFINGKLRFLSVSACKNAYYTPHCTANDTTFAPKKARKNTRRNAQTTHQTTHQTMCKPIHRTTCKPIHDSARDSARDLTQKNHQ